MFAASYKNTERGARERFRPDQSVMETALAKATNEAKAQASVLIRAAKEEAERIIEAAMAKAETITAEAVGKAEKVLGVAGLENSNDKMPAIKIIRMVAKKHGISVASIKSETRAVPIVAIRHEAMALVYVKRPDLSLPAIGRIFGRDHTTILNAVRKMGVYRGNQARGDGPDA